MRRVVLGLVLVLAAAWAGTFRQDRLIRKQVQCSARQKVVVVHRYGSIAVTGDNGRVVNILARVQVTAGTALVAREFADGIDVTATSAADSVLVTTVYPTVSTPDTQLSYEVSLELGVPAGARFEARNAFGDVRVEDLSGGSLLRSRYGNVDVERCRQVRVVNQYGDVSLLDVIGPAHVDNAFGDVVLRRTRGSVEIDNRYGAVDADGPNGDVHIANRFGSVVTRHGQGRMVIANRYGSVADWVDDPGLSVLDLVSEMGQVELTVLDGVPFRLGGSTHEGEIQSGLPLFVDGDSGEQSVTGYAGQGGPTIRVKGLWSNFNIQPEANGRWLRNQGR